MPTIALSMIVKNEEVMLQGCLESVREFVDEMIVVDTGSTDKTKQIALDAGAKVVDFDWIDDFSAARNFAKSQTKCDYIISLDADERLVLSAPDLLRETIDADDKSVIFVRLTPAISIDSDLQEVLSGNESNGAATFLPRILKNFEGNDWVGKIHEHPINTMDASYHLVDIIHLGADEEFRTTHKKGERNLRLLEKELVENPDQHPIFFSYLAGERHAIGDLDGQKDALRMGWEVTMAFLESRKGHQVASTGSIALYPAVLISSGEYEEGLKCFADLINNLQVFSGNPVNTLYEVIQTLFQIHLPLELHSTFYQLIYDGSEILQTFEDSCFPEPMIDGVCTFKALQMKVVACLKLKRLEEAEKIIEELKQYSNSELEASLFELELMIEKGEVFEAMKQYPALLQENLSVCPDIWIIGCILLISLGQEKDSEEFLQRAIELPTKRFLSRHRINILKGLFVRKCLFDGKPIPGYGAYGVLGSLLSRKPLQCTAEIPSTLIAQLVDKYVELGKLELLLRFFDDRAEKTLPGCGDLVKKFLIEKGFDLHDDGKTTPIVILSDHSKEILWLFNDHDGCTVHNFSSEVSQQIQGLLQETVDESVEDMLFGDNFFSDVEDDKDEIYEVLSAELDEYTCPVVVNWSSDWPSEMLREVFPDSPVIVYISDPSASDTSKDFLRWHFQNREVVVSLGKNIYLMNAEELSTQANGSVSRLLAWCGLNNQIGLINKDLLPDYDRERLKEWSSETDESQLKVWGFLN
jgi:glycosyltransferase involved in cell wall biosynthesis